MNALTKFAAMLAIALAWLPATAMASEEVPIGEVVERHLSLDGPVTEWVQNPDRVDEELGDSIELRETRVDALETIKLLYEIFFSPLLFG